MISKNIKKILIKTLIEEIENISPEDLEIIGVELISILEGKKLIQKGINKDHRPVPYTIDSYSDNSLIVAEFSCEKNYFKNSSKKEEIPFFKKIDKDLIHIIEHCKPNTPEKIYLISSQEEPRSFRKKFNKSLNWKKYSEIIIFYDSNRLAEEIYKHSIILNMFATFCKPFFPIFYSKLEEFEYYGKVPLICNNYVENPLAINEITEHFTNKNICVLYGISGSGKTQLATNYVYSNYSNFQNYIWITGSDWKKGTVLSSIQRTRGGSPINVAGLFNSLKTILIIDDIDRSISVDDFGELSDGFLKGGKVLITSQLSTKNNLYIHIPDISDTIAFQILGDNIKNRNKYSIDIIKLCKPSLLILSVIQSTISSGYDREILYQEILESPIEISNDSGESIIKLLLSKLDTSSLEALKKIANSGLTIFDSKFLGFFIKNLQLSRLEKLSLVLPTEIDGCLKVHNLISVSIRDKINTNEILDSLEKFIIANKYSMSSSIIRQIHLSQDVIVSKYDVNVINWVTYVLLQIEGKMKYQIIELLYNKKIDESIDFISIISIIDAKEGYSYTLEHKERNSYYNNCIKEYEKVLSETSNTKIKIELLHHLGKTYRRIREFDKAIKCFNELLELSPSMHATYLQIIHIGTQNKSYKSLGESYVQNLLIDIFENKNNVPLRVSLALIARLRSYYNVYSNLTYDQIVKLSDLIGSASLKGFGQVFEAFVSFTSMFNYNYSPLCIKLLKNQKNLLTITPEALEEDQWKNACEVFINLSNSTSDKFDENFLIKNKEISLLFANEIYIKKNLDKYEGRILAKAFINNQDYNKALGAIDKVKKDEQNHWLLYRKAEAQLKLIDTDSITTAQEALKEALKDEKANNFISTYHDLISKCAQLIDNKELAILESKLAWEKCDDKKYKLELETRYKDLVLNVD